MAAPLLIVDDYPEALSSYRALFEQQGYQVLTASTGAEALQCILTHQPGLVIVDDDPGVISAVALVAQIKRLSQELGRRPVPVVAVREDFEAGREPVLVGVDLVVSKPLNFKLLDEVVRTVCTAAQSVNLSEASFAASEVPA